MRVNTYVTTQIRTANRPSTGKISMFAGGDGWLSYARWNPEEVKSTVDEPLDIVRVTVLPVVVVHPGDFSGVSIPAKYTKMSICDLGMESLTFDDCVVPLCYYVDESDPRGSVYVTPVCMPSIANRAKMDLTWHDTPIWIEGRLPEIEKGIIRLTHRKVSLRKTSVNWRKLPETIDLVRPLKHGASFYPVTIKWVGKGPEFMMTVYGALHPLFTETVELPISFNFDDMDSLYLAVSDTGECQLYTPNAI